MYCEWRWNGNWRFFDTDCGGTVMPERLERDYSDSDIPDPYNRVIPDICMCGKKPYIIYCPHCRDNGFEIQNSRRQPCRECGGRNYIE